MVRTVFVSLLHDRAPYAACVIFHNLAFGWLDPNLYRVDKVHVSDGFLWVYPPLWGSLLCIDINGSYSIFTDVATDSPRASRTSREAGTNGVSIGQPYSTICAGAAARVTRAIVVRGKSNE